MVFAVIPWAERFYNNILFDASSDANKNGLVEPFVEMKECLENQGHSISTIDLYDDLNKVDFFLFFDWFPTWIIKLASLGLDSRMVYCNAEPPSVNQLHTREGYKKILKFFPYVMTWNKDFVDNKRFFWKTIPYNFVLTKSEIPYENKKLLTSISANKKSSYVDELYSERERLISYFETTMPDQFDMYGVGWDKNTHPSYKGRPESKAATYAGYKYALALENTRNIRGYVTEKIFDCLTCGIVPVYLGAEDITEYVSPSCFIDYRKFESPELLSEFLCSITPEQYKSYVDEGEKCVSSEKLQNYFGGKMLAQNFLNMAESANLTHFKIERIDYIYLLLKMAKSDTVHYLKQIVKKNIKRNK